MARYSALLAGLMGVGVTLGASAGLAQAADKPFYEGKTITFIAGLAAGSGADLDCRMMAQYIGKYIPGNPAVIVKNMPGANSIIADNYVGREAKKDGLTMLCGGVAANNQFTKNPALQVDLTQFEAISGHGDTGVVYARADIAPGIKSGEDLFKVNPHDLIIGGFGVSAQKDISMRAFFAAAGIEGYQYVTGFDGEGAGRAAIQQKFINMWLESLTSYTLATVPTLVKSGVVVPLFQLSHVRDSRAADVPTYGELFQAHFGKLPTTPAWQVLDTVASNVNTALEWLALPPGSPSDAVAAMRAAIDPLDHDPGFMADAAKLRSPGNLERPGAEVAAAVNKFLNMPPETLAFYNQLVTSGTALAQKK